MLNYFFVLLLGAQPVPTPQISQEIKASPPKVQFEKFVAYTRTEKYELLNQYLSKSLHDSISNSLLLGISNQVSKETFSLKTLTKMEYIEEVRNDSESCLFYNVQFSDSDEFYPGQSAPVIMAMLLESGEWKFDALVIPENGKPLIETCKKHILNTTQ